MTDKNYINADSIQAATNTFVPETQKKAYVPGIILGICGIIGSILMPVIGLPFIVAGFILISKNSERAKTGAAKVFCVLASVVCVLNAAAGIYLHTHPEVVQDMTEQIIQNAQQADQQS